MQRMYITTGRQGYSIAQSNYIFLPQSVRETLPRSTCSYDVAWSTR